MRPDLFWLGTHRVNWLWSHHVPEEVPLFVSYQQMKDRRSFETVGRRWALDSGGFSEIKAHGDWTIDVRTYVSDVRWMSDNLGGLVWAASQDWMCEPFMIEKTGLTIREHQKRTVENYLELKMADADLPFVPVLQGWQLVDYLEHIVMYDRYGIDLTRLPLVGIGSVCRRQATSEIGLLISEVAAHGIRLHGFGVKAQGLEMYSDYLQSADSMAWSFSARAKPILLEGCSGHKNCANCERWAMVWRERVLAKLSSPNGRA